MKQYIELCIKCENEEVAEILTAFLADFPFESFDSEPENKHTLLKAYILAPEWDGYSVEVKDIIAQYGELTGLRTLEDENWNAQWEAEGFERVEIDDIMVIRAPHHAPAPDNCIDIIVTPQMSFGSGHHQTTRMMCRLIHDISTSGTVLDVGCGTGVLSIAALKCGAKSADAIDIDIWSVESAKSAAELNNLEQHIEVIHGTVESIEGKCYDMVVANINRNIILNDIERYIAAMKSGGHLLLSGFLSEDVSDIEATALAHSLAKQRELSDDNWRALHFTKL